MKKKKFKNLILNKKSISLLNDKEVKGGTGGQATFEDENCVMSLGVLICGATSIFPKCAAACFTTGD